MKLRGANKLDKNSIKKFAINARKDLIKQVKQKAYEIGIEEDKIFKPDVEGEDSIKIHNRFLNKKEVRQRKRLISEIEAKGYQQVMEEVAYTWFNRFVALRFMEVNDYLPTGVRVLSSEKEGKTEPDIINEILNIDLDIDEEKVYQFEDDNDTNSLYRYLLIKQCNSLHDIMPFIFEKIADYTEILLPNNLLKEGSVIRNMVDEIDNEDWHDVEIIGWLYQFYISEKKDEVFGSKGKVKKEEIPAATQLFTPDWIVRYMVENSLGRYWLESNPNESLKDNWDYYLEEAEQEPEVKKELEEIRDRNINPEEITFLDPAAGSGHILVYAFEVLYDIYKTAGYMESSIPQLILNNNLYGLEICDRAAQLASLSVMMKARQKDSRIFKKEANLNIVSIQESNIINKKAIDLLVDNIEEQKYKNYLEKDLKYLIDLFQDAKNYGSILKIEQDISIDLINKALDNLKNSTVDLFGGINRDIVIELLPKLLEQYKIMKNKYDIVVTNPPYMGNWKMNSSLKKYTKKNYKVAKSDLFSIFIIVSFRFIKKNRYIGMITQHSWMFLKSYKKLRDFIIENLYISSMIHLGTDAFKEIGGEVVQTTSFIINSKFLNNYKGNYVRLVNYKSKEKKNLFDFKGNYYYAKMKDFRKIPGNPFSYWVSDNIKELFKKQKQIKNYGKPIKGLDTCDNARFVRYWYEVNLDNVKFNAKNNNETKTGHKWFPYIKGGPYRKWYGNKVNIVNWENNGEILRDLRNPDGTMKSRPQNTSYYFKKGITWSSISGSDFSVRKLNKSIFGGGGSALFVNQKNYLYFLSFLNSKIINHLMQILNPTLNILVGDLLRLPIIIPRRLLQNSLII